MKVNGQLPLLEKAGDRVVFNAVIAIQTRVFELPPARKMPLRSRYEKAFME
jgi:hypothetical protein